MVLLVGINECGKGLVLFKIKFLLKFFWIFKEWVPALFIKQVNDCYHRDWVYKP